MRRLSDYYIVDIQLEIIPSAVVDCRRSLKAVVCHTDGEKQIDRHSAIIIVGRDCDSDKIIARVDRTAVYLQSLFVFPVCSLYIAA